MKGSKTVHFSASCWFPGTAASGVLGPGCMAVCSGNVHLLKPDSPKQWGVLGGVEIWEGVVLGN